MLGNESIELPIINVAPFVQGDAASKRQVAQEIYQACHQVGFLYLTHHGIDPGVIDRTFEQSRAFFALPVATKQKIAWSNEVSNRGYVGMEREHLDQTKPGDLKEAFNVGKERAEAEVESVNPPLVVNRWPADLPLFKNTICHFFDECAVVVNRLFQAFAIALNMPEFYIVEKHHTQDFTLRLLHYPPLAAVPKPGQIRAGAHSDYGSLTLLFQDDVGGLEVQTASGDWVPAPAIPGAILVNTGDLMQRWSNDVFCSTKHRVALPQGEAARRDRYSIAFFCQPDAEAEIVCFPSCLSADNPPRYAPITSGEYLLSRLQATY
ncbi:isopenicillin N synthase family dioxygenase [Thermocoleostomius sinensis]|uniref:Isopenicillin N synthase family oxygenase n=1 Tax=Thermocoleostomius sinensis A174 TaxID=2016057 RepID=A0A9E9C6J3_9CYAN|nr:2-oxoglutarate and iron-dependent oxygenase domain-containing protein [Thermocoleostomius sinensis]WAL59314.1 isopenicillin N synthase family oxygenase [Thermocoleostomius sinensis A174]